MLSEAFQVSRGRRVLIGYMVPEFPGQTHIMFWREILALREHGVDVALISTRRPNSTIFSHSWANQATADTTYLYPLELSAFRNAFIVLLRAGPRRLARLFRALASSRDMTAVQRVKLLPLIVFAGQLIHLSRRQGWSHLHVGSCGNSAFVAAIAAEVGDISVSLSLLGPRLDTYGPGQEFKWSRAAFGIFQSEALLSETRCRLGHAMPNRVAVAPVGVNIEAVCRRAPYRPWTGAGVLRVYSCGRLNSVKGHEDVILAMRNLRDRGIDVQLRIAGEDELGGKGHRRKLERLVQSQGLQDTVIFLGAVSEETNINEYRSAHVYAMGSLDEAAGAVAAMEAMAMELPVVMTRVGATEELIQHGVNGFLVEPRQPDQISDAILLLATDAELATTLGIAGRQTVASRFHHRRSAAQINAFLREADAANIPARSSPETPDQLEQ